jgi:hypothetical protein
VRDQGSGLGEQTLLVLGTQVDVTVDVVSAGAAQELVERDAEGFAADVPQGDVDRGDDGAEDSGGGEEPAAGQHLPVMFDATGIGADEVVGQVGDGAADGPPT